MGNICVKVFGLWSVAQEKMVFKGLFYFNTHGHFIQQTTSCAFLVEGNMRNISLKLF